MPDERKAGAYSQDGNLFYKLLDGSVVTCVCIKHAYADSVALACGGEVIKTEKADDESR